MSGIGDYLDRFLGHEDPKIDEVGGEWDHNLVQPSIWPAQASIRKPADHNVNTLFPSYARLRLLPRRLMKIFWYVPGWGRCAIQPS